MTKTEIFSLALTALFVLTVTVASLRRDGHAGVTVTTEKNVQAEQSLPQKVELNSAGVDELQRLPGIGPVLAERIVAWRQANGIFRAPEDLLAVEGIGLATLEALRDMIEIREVP